MIYNRSFLWKQLENNYKNFKSSYKCNMNHIGLSWQWDYVHVANL